MPEKRLIKTISILLLLFFLASIHAYAEPSVTSTGEFQITRIVISPSDAKLRKGMSVQFVALAYDKNNRPMPFKPVWETTGGGTISDTGLFKATVKGYYSVNAKVKSGNTFGQALVVINEN